MAFPETKSSRVLQLKRSIYQNHSEVTIFSEKKKCDIAKMCDAAVSKHKLKSQTHLLSFENCLLKHDIKLLISPNN